MVQRKATTLSIVLAAIQAATRGHAWVIRYPSQISSGRLHKAFSTTNTCHRSPAFFRDVVPVALGATRSPSRVSDPDGPTPDVMDTDDIEEVDPDTVEGLKEIMSQDELPRPIPHQPWRRGSMDGCEAPIDVDWRRAAEQVIYTSAKVVGAKVLDVTWFLTQVIVTLDENMTVEHDLNLFKSSGPVIDVVEPSDPLYCDPNDPEPEEITTDDEILYQRQTEEEQEAERVRNNNRWANKDEDDDPNEPHNPLQEADPKVPLYMNEEGRPEIALRATEEEQERYLEMEKTVDMESLHLIDTAALSTIAGAIMDALGEVEDELRILERHELILASPGASDVLETQKQFNAYRGQPIVVETQDPFESNRTLRGRLVDRNSMDLFINQRGRLVTIPLCFVKCVRIPVMPDENDDDFAEEEEEDYEEAEPAEPLRP